MSLSVYFLCLIWRCCRQDEYSLPGPVAVDAGFVPIAGVKHPGLKDNREWRTVALGAADIGDTDMKNDWKHIRIIPKINTPLLGYDVFNEEYFICSWDGELRDSDGLPWLNRINCGSRSDDYFIAFWAEFEGSPKDNGDER